MTKVSIVRCEDYDIKTLTIKIQQVISQIDKIEDIIKPGKKILIKPNLLGPYTPDKAITTHPEFVRAVIKIIKDAGAIPSIGDSPSVLNATQVFEKTYIKKIAEEEKVELINFNQLPTKEFQIKHKTVKKIHILQKIFEFDAIINLPKLKTHSLTILTCCVKNLYGVVPGLLKSQYHRLAPSTDSFSKLLASIYKIVQPKILLNIVDAIVGMEGEGPTTGRIRKFGLILASKDAVALDVLLFNMFNIDSERIPLINYCRDLGETNIKKITINNKISFKDYVFKNPILPKTHIVNYIPYPIANILKKFIWFRPKILSFECRLCMKCQQICPVGAITRNTPVGLNINYKTCISCFCCYEVCQYNAVKLVESLLIKIVYRLYRLFSKT